MRSWKLTLIAVLFGGLVGCAKFGLEQNASGQVRNPPPVSTDKCVPEARWYIPQERRLATSPSIMATLAEHDVLLLGEVHDSQAHHLWQLQVIAAMHGIRENIAIGMEMLPRSVQPILDKWSANELTPEEFLRLSNWYDYWQFDADLYMPILQFARINRIPVYALNVDKSLVKNVRENGWSGVAVAERMGITDPAPAQEAYLDLLLETFGMHGAASAHGSTSSGTSPAAGAKSDPRFLRFVENQLLWDRAMAQGLSDAWQRDRESFVIGIMGSGHVIFDFGVAHQLNSLGIRNVATATPWDGQFDCNSLNAGFADAVFGLSIPDEVEDNERPRLGVNIENHRNGVRVVSVVEKSVAANAGMLNDDVIVEMAGRAVVNVREVVEQVRAMVPGTWLPLVVERKGQRVDLVGRFPPKSPGPS